MKIPNYESPEFMEFIRKIPIVEFHSFSTKLQTYSVQTTATVKKTSP